MKSFVYEHEHGAGEGAFPTAVISYVISLLNECMCLSTINTAPV